MENPEFTEAKNKYNRSVKKRAATMEKWVQQNQSYVPPVLFVYQIGNELFFKGNPVLVNEFHTSEIFKTAWEEAISKSNGVAEGERDKGVGEKQQGVKRGRQEMVDFKDIDPMTIVLKDLERIITNAVTGGYHIKGIWDLPKPTWWPDDVKFCSPNFRKHWGKEELSELEKRQVGVALKQWVCEQSGETREQVRQKFMEIEGEGILTIQFVMRRIAVMDSMLSSRSYESERIIEIAKSYLQAVSCIEKTTVPDLAYFQTQCAQQSNSIDCGIYMLGNIEFLLKKEYTIKEGVVRIHFDKFDSTYLRLDLLRKMYELQ